MTEEPDDLTDDEFKAMRRKLLGGRVKAVVVETRLKGRRLKIDPTTFKPKPESKDE